MSIGPVAKRWFLSKYGESENRTCASKYYLPEESWPRRSVWWLRVPPQALDISLYNHVNFICQVAPSKDDFHYLKVPVAFLLRHAAKFHKIAGKIDLYLSADPDTLFLEIRGEEMTNFSEFLVS